MFGLADRIGLGPASLAELTGFAEQMPIERLSFWVATELH